MKRFRTTVNTTPGLTDKEIINTFANGVRNHNCAASISAKEPKTLGQLMDVLKKATALDDRLTRQQEMDRGLAGYRVPEDKARRTRRDEGGHVYSARGPAIGSGPSSEIIWGQTHEIANVQQSSNWNGQTCQPNQSQKFDPNRAREAQKRWLPQQDRNAENWCDFHATASHGRN